MLSTQAAFRRVFPGVMFAMFLASADQTILASALPAIAGALGGLADVSWAVIGYLLAATVAAPLYGHLGDRFGRRRMLMIALAIFTTASAICMVTPSLPALIAARTLQGLGGGGLMTMAQALIGESLRPRERGRYAGWFATIFVFSTTTGPVLGAYLTEHVSWRAVFAINLPLGLLGVFLALRIPVVPGTRHGPFRPDVVGALLFSAATVALLFGLTSAGHRFGWVSWELAALLAGALAGYVAPAFWERRAADPIVPLRFFGIPSIIRSAAVVLCFAASLFSMVFYLPFYLQFGRGLGIGTSGVLLLPFILSMVATAAVVGRLLAKTGHATLFPKTGLSVAAVAFTTLATFLPLLPTWLVMGLTMACGVGLGMVMAPTQVLVQHAAGHASLGAATASVSFSRSIGGALGVALVGAALFALSGKSADTAALRELLERGPGFAAGLPTDARAALATQLDAAYRIVFGLLACVAGLGAWIASTVPKHRF